LRHAVVKVEGESHVLQLELGLQLTQKVDLSQTFGIYETQANGGLGILLKEFVIGRVGQILRIDELNIF